MARRVEMKRAVVASVVESASLNRAGEKDGKVVGELRLVTTWHPDIHPLGWALMVWLME